MNSAKFLLWTTCGKFDLCHDYAVHLQQPNGSRACLLLHFAEHFIDMCLSAFLPVWNSPCLVGCYHHCTPMCKSNGDRECSQSLEADQLHWWHVHVVVLPLSAISQPILGSCSGFSKKEVLVLTSNLDIGILFGRWKEFSCMDMDWSMVFSCSIIEWCCHLKLTFL